MNPALPRRTGQLEESHNERDRQWVFPAAHRINQAVDLVLVPVPHHDVRRVAYDDIVASRPKQIDRGILEVAEIFVQRMGPELPECREG